MVIYTYLLHYRRSYYGYLVILLAEFTMNASIAHCCSSLPYIYSLLLGRLVFFTCL